MAATQSSDGTGGGINGNRTNAKIALCIITGNEAQCGGGISKCGGDIIGCAIENNRATGNNEPVGASVSGGGGLYYCYGNIINCTISGNIAFYRGGGLYRCSGNITNCNITNNVANDDGGLGGGGGGLSSCDAKITTCVIVGNEAKGSGGGLDSCYDDITSCIIAGNKAGDRGGGLYFCDGRITNCIIVGNKDDDGQAGGIGWYGGTITNCVIWGNRPNQIYKRFGKYGVDPTYSCIQDGWPGKGNISANPLFVDAANGDYHLRPESTCIDAGDPDFIPAPGETDIDGEPRVMGDRVDMGADEYTSTPSIIIGISSKKFSFEAIKYQPNPEPQILSIWNAGYRPLSWQLSEDCPWLAVYPTSGLSTGEITEVAISVDISGMDMGLYSSELTITADEATNSPKTVEINLSIDQAVIELSEAEFEFFASEGGPNPPDQTVTISNSGVGKLNWAIIYDCNWLTVDPDVGNSTGETDEITLSVDVLGLTVGEYDCDLMVSDPCAANSPQMVAVTVYIFGTDAELHVPSEFETIQVAIDIAKPGHAVIVAPGTYTGPGNRDLDFHGKAITLRSADPNDSNVVAATIIDCNGSQEDPHRGFYFHSGEGPNSVVSGLTIRNGFAYGGANEPNAYGGAIACESNSNPAIINCKIIANTADAGDNYCGCEPDCKPANGYGGGIYCSESSPTITDCTITNNMAKGAKTWTGCVSPDGGHAYGGVIFCTSNSNPMISNSMISNNEARGGRGADGSLGGNASAGGNAYGGGIYSDLGSNPILEDCSIMANTISGGNGGRGHYCTAEDAGDVYGAGICCGRDSTVMIYNCRISNNQATGGTGGTGEGEGEVGDPGSGGNAHGGGIYCGGASQLTTRNCNIAGNIASGGKGGNREGGYRTGPVGGNGGNGGNSHGGGICCDTDSGSEIENCTIAGNKVLGGKGGIGETRSAIAGIDGYNGDAYGGGIYYDTNSVGAITNSIVWSNDGGAIYGSRPDVTYGDIEGGWPGEGNIDADPLFVRPGYWADANDPSIAVEPNDPNAVWVDGDYHLSQVAAGQGVDSPCVDAGSDTAVNLGMDQLTTRRDKVGDEGIVDMGYHYCENVADLNDDGKVDVVDLAILACQWQQEPGVLSADIQPVGGDGVVDEGDLVLLADNWLWTKGLCSLLPF